jgi:hypothetical protein
MRGINRRTMVYAGLDIKRDPISKTIKTLKGWGIARMIEHLPSKCKVLRSNSSIIQNNRTMKKVSVVV